MTKKRRTRQQKIISKLRRQLKQQKIIPVRHQSAPDQRRNAGIKSIKPIKSVKSMKKGELAFAYAPELIKKDLLKTLLLSLIFLAIILIIKFSRLEEVLFH